MEMNKMEMEFIQKLGIAKMVYQSIKNTVDCFENRQEISIHVHWDGCVTVDGELFNKEELQVKDE